jgi:peptide/nickel transport system permease protein
LNMSRFTFSKALSMMPIPKGTAQYFVYSGIGIVGVALAIALLAPFMTHFDPTVTVDAALLSPSIAHPFGTNNLGYDMYSRALFGTRVVLYIVTLSTSTSMVAGVTLGLVSGYFGGYRDRILTIVMDSMYSFPDIVLAIAVSIALGPGIYNAAAAIAIVYIPTYFRMVRGQALSIREQNYVLSARMMGAKAYDIMVRYVLPSLVPVVVTVFTLNVTDAILTEAALSYLGLGVVPPTPDWGSDLRSGQVYLPSGYWWLVTIPGVMIMLLTIGFSLLGEGLSDLLNPRLSRE